MHIQKCDCKEREIMCFVITCTAMSSGLLDAVNTATHRDRASNNI